MMAGPQFGPVVLPDVQAFVDKKTAAGICGIMLGGLGIHKFILGLHGPATIMLMAWLIGLFLGVCLIFPLLATSAMQVVGFIEGVLYLTKSDAEFYQTYAIERREWF